MRKRKKNIPKIILIIIAVIINVVLIIMVLESIADALKVREENVKNGIQVETNTEQQEENYLDEQDENDFQEQEDEDSEMSIKDKLKEKIGF